MGVDIHTGIYKALHAQYNADSDCDASTNWTERERIPQCRDEDMNGSELHDALALLSHIDRVHATDSGCSVRGERESWLPGLDGERIWRDGGDEMPRTDGERGLCVTWR